MKRKHTFVSENVAGRAVRNHKKKKKKNTRSADLCLLGHELLSEYPSVSNRRPRHDKKPDIFINVKSHFHIYSSFIIEAPCQVS
jgi:hypothetical protein